MIGWLPSTQEPGQHSRMVVRERAHIIKRLESTFSSSFFLTSMKALTFRW